MAGQALEQTHKRTLFHTLATSVGLRNPYSSNSPAPNSPSPPTWPQGFGVPGSRASTCEELAAQLAAALERQGPSLIEAVL